MVTTLGPGRPGSRAARHAARNRSNVSVLTSPSAVSSLSSQRQNANKSNPYARTVFGE
jgi:hypothetical protein